MSRSVRAFVPAAAVAASLAWSPSAAACGGFFCNNVPIDQSKERIVFAIDEDEGTVEVHVQIFYTGSAERFAWVVPVPAVPEIGLSSDAMFQYLGWRTQPTFQLQWEERGTCEYDGGILLPGVAEDDFDAAGGVNDTAVNAPSGVDVLASGQTGPFDWKVVSATDAQALLTWLKDPDGNPQTDDAYDIPPDIAGTLGSYLAGGAKFAAFKLTNGSDAGDIAPIRMTYEGDAASIPLILTSIAATPDMRLEPYVFADARAVPSNYLHVRVNEAKINWLSGGANYDDVITMAADEAGGQAFATDYYGPTAPLKGALYREGQFDLDAIRELTAPADVIDQLLWQGFPRNAAMQEILRDHLPMPEALAMQGVSDRDFYNCISCYSEYLDGYTFDADALADALDERIVQPLIDAEALFTDFPMLTRMTSSISPAEMTLDPLFVLNRDMTDEVPSSHAAKLVIDCGDGGLWSEADRWIELADGRVIQVPPDSWFAQNGQSYDDWGPGDDLPAAEVIEQTGAQGQPVPISDRGEEIDQVIEGWNDTVLGGDGGSLGGDGTDGDPQACGCDQRGGGLGWGLVLTLAGLAGIRRRR